MICLGHKSHQHLSLISCNCSRRFILHVAGLTLIYHPYLVTSKLINLWRTLLDYHFLILFYFSKRNTKVIKSLLNCIQHLGSNIQVWESFGVKHDFFFKSMHFPSFSGCLKNYDFCEEYVKFGAMFWKINYLPITC